MGEFFRDDDGRLPVDTGTRGGDMTERPEDRSGERRRMGPLGEGEDEETRQGPPAESDDSATRRIPTQQPAGRTEATSPEEGAGERRSPRNLRRASRAGEESSQGETRVIRTPGNTAGAAAGETRESVQQRSYFEAAEEREERLRDIYGGVDWLASFLGFVFAAVAGSVFAGIASLVLVPFGFSLNIGAGGGVTEITTLVLLAVLIFFTYLFGGYIAGRLARFDGGRNGAMAVVWGIVVGALLLALGGILPGALFERVRGFLTDTVAPALVGLLDAGLVGLAVAVGAILVALLGGIAGGRLGSRYHAEIDRTT